MNRTSYLLTGADTLHRGPASGVAVYAREQLRADRVHGGCHVRSGHIRLGRPGDSVHRAADRQHHGIHPRQSSCPVPDGQPGELCLAGALVGAGYRNNPVQTASRFVMYTPPSGPAVRIYRTGDRVRLNDNGEIAFLGRLDDQVKIAAIASSSVRSSPPWIASSELEATR